MAAVAAALVSIEVAGEAYYDQASWDVMHHQPGFLTDEGAELRITPGDPKGIALVTAPRNPYDENAVAVFVRGHHVGYLPAEAARGWVLPIGDAEERGHLVTVQGRIWARSRGAGQVSTRVTLSLPESGALWPANAYPAGDFATLSGDFLRKVAEASKHQQVLTPWIGKDLIVELRDVDGRIHAFIDGVNVGPLTRPSHDKLAPRLAADRPTYVGGIVRSGEKGATLEIRA